MGVRPGSAGQLGGLQRHKCKPRDDGTTNHTQIDAFGLFTGQVGYAWDSALLYVKGGAAVTGSRYHGLAARRYRRQRDRNAAGVARSAPV